MASGDIVGIIGMIVPTATLGATEDTRVDGSTPVGHLPVWDFDDTAVEYLDFYCRLEGYDGGGLTITLPWSATDTTVTPHDAVLSAAIRRIAHDAEDMDAAHTYDYNNASADTEASASGEFSTVNVTFTDGADMDSLADTEPFVLRVRRVPTDGGDTLTGDLELWAFAIVIKET
jgi:hypothetical protein